MTRGADHPHRPARKTVASAFATVVLVGSLLAGSGVGTAVGASGTDAQSAPTDSASAFEVALEADGDATVAVAVSFNLTDEANRTAFESLETNKTKRNEFEARTEQRFRTVAGSAANATDREMTIEETRISFETDEETERGIVTVSATWTAFAATDGDRLTVTEPFASGFTADRPVVLRLPDGYALADATHAPTDRTDTRLVWDANTSLEGYEATIVPADETGANGGADGGDEQPGFGFGATVVAIVGATWLSRRR